MSYIAKNGRLYTSGASEALTLLDDKFSVNKSYSKGDSCIYNDYLWKFTSDKPAGEWNPSVVEQCRIMDFVDDVDGRLTQTEAKVNNVDEHLTAENNMPFRFAFDTNSGKYGYITESGGADTFNPFSDGSVGEFDTFIKRIVGSATNNYQTYKFDVEEGASYLFTLYTLHPSGGGRIRKITGGSYEILAGRYVSDTEVTSVYTPACIIHAESTTITIEALMGMSEIYLTPYACLYKLT